MTSEKVGCNTQENKKEKRKKEGWGKKEIQNLKKYKMKENKSEEEEDFTDWGLYCACNVRNAAYASLLLIGGLFRFYIRSGSFVS